jgi:putative phosphoesterase
LRVAALSDIHGNLPALEAVLSEVERVGPDLIVSCGDVASGPMPAETISLLMTLPRSRFVRGNADRGLVDAFDRKPKGRMPGPFADWCATRITRGQRDFLESFESTVMVDDVDGIGRVLFCHGSPRSDEEIMTAETSLDRMREFMAGLDADLVVCGHTHMQFDRMVDRVRVINAGSVGMPYGEPGAYWTMLGPGVRPRRTEYDREAAAARIRAAGSPEAEQFATENVLKVPTVEEAMEFLRKAEARQIALAS